MTETPKPESVELLPGVDFNGRTGDQAIGEFAGVTEKVAKLLAASTLKEWSGELHVGHPNAAELRFQSLQMLDIVAALRATLSADTDAIRKVRDEMKETLDHTWSDVAGIGLGPCEIDRRMRSWREQLDAILERRK